ncbi:hypothetical protein GGS24DRAFT_515325 [Hypoxylon argillaceum]|nr:hypothetical protein GGS24DRAFT_515325 [Hypoxylon argillaceum]
MHAALQTRRQVDYTDVDLLQKGPVTAGRAAPNSYFYIADPFLQPVPVGFTGEIVVGGVGIALGYLNREKETAARFLEDEQATPEDCAGGWISVHRTGDLGKMMPDGSLQVLGRIDGDTQVKLRGIQINLSEIECAISSIPGIQDVAASKRRLGPDELDYLVAHVVVSDEQLRPSIIIPVDDLPKGQTGKVDRKAVAQWVIVLSGATGHLGRELLRQLIDNPHVQEIHCVAVRQPSKLDGLSSKVHVYTGDLSAPRLGLSPELAATIMAKVMAKADAIIHNGANADNVGSTRELVQLAAPHFASTAGVTLYFAATTPSPAPNTELTFGEVSVAAFPPPTDGIDGYTASKWASEHLLERANAQSGLPVAIHRPANIARADVPELDRFRSLLLYCSRMGAVPVSEKLRGFLNLVPVEFGARDILVAAVSPGAGVEKGVRYRHQTGEVNLMFESLRAYVAQETGRPLGEIDMLPFGEWTVRAVEVGMHPTVGSYFNAAELGEVVRYPMLVRAEA